MIKYGFKSLTSLSKFFSYRNDIDIYTEDKDADKEFYKTLFKNLFGDELLINDITPLGCKVNVLNAFDNQNKKDGRRKYFIVDGDLELINDNNRKNERNLIVLDSYCIENYLINEQGIIDFLYFSNGVESKEQQKNKLNFNKWIGYNTNVLVELFINFAILRKYGGGPKLKKAKDFLTSSSKQTILDKQKIKDYSLEIKNSIIEHLEISHYSNSAANELYESEFNELNLKWKYNSDTFLKIVSAKNYTLPMLQFRINHCINSGSKALFPKNSLKLFLASNSDLSRLNFLKERIK